MTLRRVFVVIALLIDGAVGSGDRFQQMANAPSDPLSEAATRNLTVAMELRATARALAAARLRAFRPELSEAAIEDEVRALFRRAAG